MTQGLLAFQAEVSVPGWIGLSGFVGTDGRPTRSESPLGAGFVAQRYFMAPFDGFYVGGLASWARLDHERQAEEFAPLVGIKWIQTSRFTADLKAGWGWVQGDVQDIGGILYSCGLGYTW